MPFIAPLLKAGQGVVRSAAWWAVVLGVTAVGVFVRVQPLPALGSEHLIGTDSYRLVRQAGMILADGALPDRDMDRSAPDGKDLTTEPHVFPAALALAHRAVTKVAPSATLYQTAILYPVASFVAISLLFFVVVRSVFGEPVGLVATIALAAVPSNFLSKTSAGHADRDAFVLLAFLGVAALYRRMKSAPRGWHSAGLQVVFGAVVGGIALTWQGSAFLVLILVLTEAATAYATDASPHDGVRRFVWVPPFYVVTSWWMCTGHPQPMMWAAYALPFLLVVGYHLPLILGRTRSPGRRQRWIVAICSAPGVVGGGWVLLRALIPFAGLLTPLGQDGDLFPTIQELHPMYLRDWWRSFGPFAPVCAVGVMVLATRMARRYGIPIRPVVVAQGAALGLVVVGSLLGAYAIPPTLQGLPFLLTTLGVLILAASWVWYVRWVRQNVPGSVDGLAALELLLYHWLCIALYLTCRSKRFDIWLTPPLMVAGAVAVVAILRRTRVSRLALGLGAAVLAWQTVCVWLGPIEGRRSPDAVAYALLAAAICAVVAVWVWRAARTGGWLGPCIVAVSAFLALGALGGVPSGLGYAAESARRMRGDGLYRPNGAWTAALTWLGREVGPGRVVAAWWDYGSWINAVANQRTVIDEEQERDRVQQFAREVLSTDDDDEALAFLSRHGATHLLLSEREMETLRSSQPSRVSALTVSHCVSRSRLHPSRLKQRPRSCR